MFSGGKERKVYICRQASQLEPLDLGAQPGLVTQLQGEQAK